SSTTVTAAAKNWIRAARRSVSRGGAAPGGDSSPLRSSARASSGTVAGSASRVSVTSILFGHPQPEGGAEPGPVGDPRGAAVGVGDAAHEREAEPRPARGGGHAVERLQHRPLAAPPDAAAPAA